MTEQQRQPGPVPRLRPWPGESFPTCNIDSHQIRMCERPVAKGQMCSLKHWPREHESLWTEGVFESESNGDGQWRAAGGQRGKKLHATTGGKSWWTALTDTGGLDPGPSEVWQAEAIGGALQEVSLLALEIYSAAHLSTHRQQKKAKESIQKPCRCKCQ